MPQRHNVRSIIKFMLFLSCLMAPPIANSAEYYFCMVFDTNREKLYYYSDIYISETNIDDMKTYRGFVDENEARERRDFHIINTSGYCVSEAKLSETEEEYRKLLDKHRGGLKYPYTRPPAPSKPYVWNVPPEPSIIIEETKPVTLTPKQLAEREAQERKAAADRARMAADAARHDARVQAAIAEQLRLRKLQGSRQ